MYSKSYIRERIDFVTALLTSNFIYFDIDRFIWKTRVTHEPLMNRTHPHDTMSSRPDQNYQIPYETLIQRQRDTKRSIGKGGNTILHLAIQANATEVALEIIRIEYQTFLHIHDRSDGLTEYLGIRTFLEAANKKGYTYTYDLGGSKGQYPDRGRIIELWHRRQWSFEKLLGFICVYRNFAGGGMWANEGDCSYD